MFEYFQLQSTVNHRNTELTIHFHRHELELRRNMVPMENTKEKTEIEIERRTFVRT